MSMKMRVALTTAVVVAALFVIVEGQISADCGKDFLYYCEDLKTTSGVQTCCSHLKNLYRTDRSCLCGLFRNNDEQIISMLDACNDYVPAGTRVCSSDTSPPSDLYSPPYPVTYPSHRPPPSKNVDRSPSKDNVDDSPSKSKLSIGAVIGIIVGVLVFVGVLVLVFVLLLCKRSRPPPTQQQLTGYPQHPGLAQSQVQGYPQQPVLVQHHVPDNNQQTPPKIQSSETPQVPAEATKIIGATCTLFSYEELKNATNGFSDQNEIGRGGFGVVYRGTLYNGTQVAIKQLRAETFMEIEDFNNEIETISRVHHNNLVSLFGYCSTKDRKLMVLELVPNGTLESHLHEGKEGKTMDWAKRIRVALGSAKGFAYLHEDCHPQIVHRDIKAANILLDNNFVPKVADFGLAKKADAYTVRIVGTPGYIDPEYRFGDQPTAKSDVYSFGVILLELITGRKPVDYSANKTNLVDWARPLLSQALITNSFDAIVDERLENKYDHKEMIRVICCSASCIRHSADRPSMSRVVHILEGLVPIDKLKHDLLQTNQSFSNSSASFGYESSHQSSAAGTANFNESRVRSVNNTSGSYAGTSGDCNDQNPFPYGARSGR